MLNMDQQKEKQVKSVRDSINSNFSHSQTLGSTKGPTIGSKADNLVSNNDSQIVNSSNIHQTS